MDSSGTYGSVGKDHPEPEVSDCGFVENFTCGGKPVIVVGNVSYFSILIVTTFLYQNAPRNVTINPHPRKNSFSW